VRLAIGARRSHIIRQMLSEGLVLGACGAAVSLAMAWALIRLLLSIKLPLPAVVAIDVPLDLRVFSFAVSIAVAAGLLAALTPALKASSLRLAADLRGELAAWRLAGRRWALRDLLVVAQLSLTMVLLVVAGLLLRTLMASQAADVGVRTAGVAMLSADTGMVRYSDQRGEQFWALALERVKSLPGVESAALVNPRLPFDVNFSTSSVRIDGKTYAPDDRGDVIATVAVSPDYFHTLGIPLVEGRGFTDGDRQGAPLVAVVNQTMARQFWPEGAIGRTFQLPFNKQTVQVVGVVRDHRLFTVAERPAPYIHFAAAQRPSGYNYVVAYTRGDAQQLLGALRRELLAMEPGLVFIGSSTMDASVMMSLLPQRVAALLATGFGAVGTVLAAIGLYGVIAFSVARRTREIGVRVAVGADRGDVLRLIVRQGSILVAIGAGTGLLLAAVAASALRGVLYGVGSFDALAWTAAVGIMLGAAVAANLVPTRRALRIDPVLALRAD
jgi:predicted permease